MVVHVLDDFYLGLTAIITVVYQLIFFTISYSCKFDLLTGTHFFPLSLLEICPCPRPA